MKFRTNHVLLLSALLFAMNANAAPVAYSVNSDSGNAPTDDSLYSIDLTSGADQRMGELISGVQTRVDTEGLAFSPDGTLWGIDDDSLTLFPINPLTGSVNFQQEVKLNGFSVGGGNDFGMTFSCDNSLYVTSVLTQNLYQVSINGISLQIGGDGALGVNISAIAAYGSPTVIYGLGNGQFLDGSSDAPNLYRIDPASGVTTLVGSLGVAAGAYNQAGLAFDAEGTLWAITDRRIINNTIENKPSQILRLDLDTGVATLVSETSEVGFESLAIAPPGGCSAADANGYEPIPTLGHAGRLLAILFILLSGMAILRSRFS